MSRKPFVAGNWKMNCTSAEGLALVGQLVTETPKDEAVEVAICPPYVLTSKVHDALRGSDIQLGAQDVFWMESGAFTGRISGAMLRDLGVTYCIVGHSETRGRFGVVEVPDSTLGFFAETDETCGLKIEALNKHGIAPILCVGETLAEREAGSTDAVIQAQISGALKGFDEVELGHLVLAYEPVWAIGTGQTCDTPEAERVCGMIRAHLASLFSGDFAERTRVLYGGSVKAANAHELFHQPNIDGGLVGGASLKSAEFVAIIRAAKPA